MRMHVYFFFFFFFFFFFDERKARATISKLAMILLVKMVAHNELCFGIKIQALKPSCGDSNMIQGFIIA
jgi:hypothetical protein